MNTYAQIADFTCIFTESPPPQAYLEIFSGARHFLYIVRLVHSRGSYTARLMPIHCAIHTYTAKKPAIPIAGRPLFCYKSFGIVSSVDFFRQIFFMFRTIIEHRDNRYTINSPCSLSYSCTYFSKANSISLLAERLLLNCNGFQLFQHVIGNAQRKRRIIIAHLHHVSTQIDIKIISRYMQIFRMHFSIFMMSF